jgi:hypothetical protein
MTYDEIVELLNTDPVAQDLMKARIPMRLAYVAKDGSARAIPISYLWNGSAFVINTPTGWPKINAFRANPRVAFTVDTTDFPPKIMLVRGEVSSMEVRQGVPDEYVEASRRIVGEDRMEEWEKGVRADIHEMMVIRITPTWVKVIDFERTYPGLSRRPQQSST